MAQDLTIQAVDRSLTSTISVLASVIVRAEHLKDQQLADDLHALLREMKRISGGIGSRGQAYKPL
jgi:hypothetical protein